MPRKKQTNNSTGIPGVYFSFDRSTKTNSIMCYFGAHIEKVNGQETNLKFFICNYKSNLAALQAACDHRWNGEADLARAGRGEYPDRRMIEGVPKWIEERIYEIEGTGGKEEVEGEAEWDVEDD